MDIDYLLANSGLPGPRGNLGLMYSFAKLASEEQVRECLAFCREDLKNSPEEFVVMCGIVGYAILNKDDLEMVFASLKDFANHSSWRIREAVAMAIQEIAEDKLPQIILLLSSWLSGTEFEQRAVVAALCEPKLLKDKEIARQVVIMLNQVTLNFVKITGKLSEQQVSLRKTLGYGWSVAIVHAPKEGKAALERLATIEDKNIRWIVKENLKKHRLRALDAKWVQNVSGTL